MTGDPLVDRATAPQASQPLLRFGTKLPKTQQKRPGNQTFGELHEVYEILDYERYDKVYERVCGTSYCP